MQSQTDRFTIPIESALFQDDLERLHLRALVESAHNPAFPLAHADLKEGTL
jgi:hypothetical protein